MVQVPAPTVHLVALLELLLFYVNGARISAEGGHVFTQVPAFILIHHTEHQEEIEVHVVAPLREAFQNSWEVSERINLG